MRSARTRDYGRRVHWRIPRRLIDCYLVGSLDLIFLGKYRGFPLNPQKVKLFAGGSFQQPREESTGKESFVELIR